MAGPDVLSLSGLRLIPSCAGAAQFVAHGLAVEHELATLEGYH